MGNSYGRSDEFLERAVSGIVEFLSRFCSRYERIRERPDSADRHIYSRDIYPDLSRFYGINPSFFPCRCARARAYAYMRIRAYVWKYEYGRASLSRAADICIDDYCSVTRTLRQLLMGEICFAIVCGRFGRFQIY